MVGGGGGERRDRRINGRSKLARKGGGSGARSKRAAAAAAGMATEGGETDQGVGRTSLGFRVEGGRAANHGPTYVCAALSSPRFGEQRGYVSGSRAENGVPCAGIRF